MIFVKFSDNCSCISEYSSSCRIVSIIMCSIFVIIQHRCDFSRQCCVKTDYPLRFISPGNVVGIVGQFLNVKSLPIFSPNKFFLFLAGTSRSYISKEGAVF
jgi:hypothetical protein